MDNFVYKVVLKNRISAEDDRVLSYLYQPIVGPESICLYKTLIFEKELSKEFKTIDLKEERLLNITGLTSNKLVNNLKKLEAIGLVQSFYNEEINKYIFNIYAPAEPVHFFENQFFDKALLKKVGKKEYELAKFIFRDEGDIPNDSGYLNSSSKFHDIFSEFSNLITEKIDNNLKLKPNKTNALIQNFDYKKFIKELNHNNCLILESDNEAKKIIQDVYSTYNLTIDEIKDSVIQAYSNEKMILEENLFYKFISQKYFKLQEATQENTFDPEEYIRNNTTIKVKEMETIEPETYLNSLLDQNTISSTQLETIDNLRDKFKLRNGSINCLLEFSYLKNKGKIVANYLYKIAATLNELNINDAQKCMEYLKVANKKSAKKYSNLQSKTYAPNYDDNQLFWKEAQTKFGQELTTDDNQGLENMIWGDF